MASPTAAAPKIKLKFGSSASTAPVAPENTPKPKRKYTKKPKPDAAGDDGASAPSGAKTTKKRPRKEDGEDEGGSNKKQQKTAGKLSIKLGLGGAGAKASASAKDTIPIKTQKGKSVAIKLMNKPQTLRIKSKATLGVPPRREPGNGYDSEADDTEIDPHVEQQFVIRMQPGEDCDYLRKAIADRTIGTKGGSNISLHFFDREARHAVVTIKGNHYAASLVDLPCIVETHKSWDRKNFYKVSDIHQMLVVTKKVQSIDEARNAEPPDGVDKSNWQFPHGLTPPMHYAKQRRFRKRVSNRTIEAVEEEVDRLLRLDEDALETQWEIFDPNAREEDEEEDAEGEMDVDGIQESIEVEDAEGEADEDDEIAQLLAAGLVGGLDEEGTIIAGSNIQASPEALQPTTETPEVASTPTAAGPSASDDSADDESDEDDDEIDEEERAAQQERAQLREEVEDIRKEIETVDNQIVAQSNKILQAKLKDKRSKLKRDLQLKLANLGEANEDDDD